MYYKMYLAFSIYSFFAFTHFFYSTCTDDVIKWYIPSGALNVSNMLAAYEGTTFTNTIPPFLAGIEEVDSFDSSGDDKISSIQRTTKSPIIPAANSISNFTLDSDFRAVLKEKSSASPTSFIVTNLNKKSERSFQNLNVNSENQVYHLLQQDANLLWIHVLEREISSIPLIFYQAMNCLIFISLSGYFSILGLTKWNWYLFFCAAFSTFTLTVITLSFPLRFYPYTLICLSVFIIIITTNFSTTPMRLPFENTLFDSQNHCVGWILNVFMSSFILFNIVYSLLLRLVSFFIAKHLLLTFYSTHEVIINFLFILLMTATAIILYFNLCNKISKSSLVYSCVISLFTSYVTLSSFVFLLNLSFYRPSLLHYVPTIDGSIGTLQIPLSPSLFFHPVSGVFVDKRYISCVLFLLLLTIYNGTIQHKHLPYTATTIQELVQYSLIPQELLEENFLRKHKKIKKKHLDT